MKKSILFVITKSNFGGAQRYVYDLARSLPADEYAVTVAFGGAGLLKEKLDAVGIPTISVYGLERDMGVLNELRAFLSLVRLFKKVRPDIVHLNSSKAGAIGAAAARIVGIRRIVFTAHGWAFNEERSFLSRMILHFIHLLTVILSHHSIAVSQKTKDQLGGPGFVQKKFLVVRNGIDIPDFAHRSVARETLLIQSPELKQQSGTKMIWVGTIAELHPTKGLRYAIKGFRGALKKYPNMVYVIIGEGEARAELEALVAHYNLAEKAFLVGYIDNAAHLLKAFDIFVLPSISEALSYTLLEAGAAQVPITASAVGGIPEIITNNETGLLVPPKEPEQLAHALIALAEKAEKRNQFGVRLSERVRREFSLTRMVRETLAVYES